MATSFRAFGVNLKQSYGPTELSGLAAVQPANPVSADTLGLPVPGTELRIGDGGEVMARGETVCLGYHAAPERTCAAHDADAWWHTGDAGSFDARGRLSVLDRLAHLGRLQDGTDFVPRAIEGQLRRSRFIDDALACGDGREFVAALVVPDRAALAEWAEQRRVPTIAFAELLKLPEVQLLLGEEIGACNADLAPALRVRRFRLLAGSLLHRGRRRAARSRPPARHRRDAPRGGDRGAVRPPRRRDRGCRARLSAPTVRGWCMPDFDWQFPIALVSSGIMIGLMYSLIALGFVLVYKATDAINFAQGEFVMLAALIAAAATGAGMPFMVAVLLALAGMIAFCFGLERVVLRKLLGRPTVAVIMATIGLASLIRGFATLAFGPGVRSLEMPVGDDPLFLGPVMLPPVQLVGAGTSLLFFEQPSPGSS